MATIAFEDLSPGTVIGARQSRSRPGLGLVEFVGSAHRGPECVLRMIFTGMFATRG